MLKNRGELQYLTAARAPHYTRTIFERRLARTPDEQRVYQAYLQVLTAAKNRAEFGRMRALAQELFGPAPQP